MSILLAAAAKLQFHLVIVSSLFFGLKPREIRIEAIEREQNLQELRFELEQLEQKEEKLQKFQKLRQEKD